MNFNQKSSFRQLDASDPASSAWVNANAGSGKTHVLVDRVIRLLLGGTDPSRIMCLTFTKAAAAEMSNRLFDRLSAWVSLDDDTLSTSLEKLGNREIDAALLQRARQLFTRALETPGGLKIQTIHAFCERVLQLFPVEAGIVPRFTVMDDRTAKEMLQQARDQLFTAALTAPDGKLGRAVSDVVNRIQAEGFEDLMRQLLGQRASLRDALASSSGIDAVDLLLRRELRVGDGETTETVGAHLNIDHDRYRQLADALANGSKTDIIRSENIRNILHRPVSTLLEFQELYFTQKDEAKKQQSIATKGVTTAHGWVASFIQNEQQRLNDGLGKLADLERIGATRSLLVVGAAIFEAYEAAKRRHGAYDFEDLIIRTGELLAERPDAAWVLYKLDGGIEHLLVDEAQDTSPAQWHIVRALTEEFFAGAGRHGGKRRTVFAVGDRKQSIFSFQGADPDMFETIHDDFKDRVNASGQTFVDVDLTVSFRSAKEILDAVDTVFASQSAARRGLDGRLLRDWSHESNRRGDRGLVELWPLIEPEDGEDEEPWTAPVDREPARSPRRRLARKLALTIKSWIGKRVIAATGHTVKPQDILVLVRVRNGFFDALIRELRQAGVPVAGADRLKLIESIAVLDLLALARFCLTPEDDYALACLLKSPVMAVPLSEDQLMDIAIGRGSVPLWQALRQSPDPVCVAAAAQLGRLSVMAAGARAFEFFSDVLMASRLRFLSRLGSEANDALDALLDAALSYEESHGATLAGFVNWFESGDVEIKRNMEQGAGEVRIMTVHGAKGLEAPIVILPDTVSMPDSSTEPPLIMIETGNAGMRIPLWKLSKLFESEAFADLKTRARSGQTDEYHRLLYVAMTRARDELYVCGCRGERKPADGCWYETVSRALKPAMRPFGGNEGWRLGPDPEFRDGMPLDASPPQSLPDWINRPPTEEIVPAEPVSVSALTRREEAAPAPARVSRGTIIHRILQRLPDLPEDRRLEHARRVAQKAGLGGGLAESLIALTGEPDLAFIFGPGGLSEIPLVAHLPELGQTVTGRIDRLVITEDAIVAVDYKTTARPPESPEDVNPDDLAQLAAYRSALRLIHPGAKVRMALLYTEAPRLLFLPDALLDRALDHIAVNRP